MGVNTTNKVSSKKYRQMSFRFKGFGIKSDNVYGVASDSLSYIKRFLVYGDQSFKFVIKSKLCGVSYTACKPSFNRYLKYIHGDKNNAYVVIIYGAEYNWGISTPCDREKEEIIIPKKQSFRPMVAL